MLKVIRQGAGWSVMRNGRLVKNAISSGVHKTKDSAVRHARRIRKETGEEIEVEGTIRKPAPARKRPS